MLRGWKPGLDVESRTIFLGVQFEEMKARGSKERHRLGSRRVISGPVVASSAAAIPLPLQPPAFVTPNQYCIPPAAHRTGKAPWADGSFRMPKSHHPSNLDGSLAAACLPPARPVRGGGTACKVQAVHADPPVPCKPEALWPMGGRTWPLGCGRVAELGLLHINHLAKALTSVEQSPTMVQSAAAPRGARPAGFWAPLHLAQHCSRLLGACLSRTLLAAGPAFPPHFVGLRRGTYLFEMRKRSGRSC